MSQFLIDKQYMPHSGGTKFYQVLRARYQPTGALASSASVTVTNWGPQAGPAGWRPIQSRGQRKIAAGDGYADAIRVKSGRGYNKEIRHGSTHPFSLLEDFKEALVSELGITDATAVLETMNLSKAAGVVPMPEGEDAPARAAARSVEVSPFSEADLASEELDGWGEL